MTLGRSRACISARWALILPLTCTLALLTASTAAAQDVWVDDDWVGLSNGTAVGLHTIGTDAFATIQAGVNALTPGGGRVHVAAGAYSEQVVVQDRIEIEGAGSTVTSVNAPATLVATFSTPVARRTVITALDASDVILRGLRIDGLGRGNANFSFLGVGYWNASGAILDCTITGVRNTPLSSQQHGIGILAGTDGSRGPLDLEIGHCVIQDWQKYGVSLSGTMLSVDMHDCVITGSGNTNQLAQYCALVGNNVTVHLRDSQLQNVRYTPASFVSAGLLVVQVAAFFVDGGLSIANCQAPVYVQNGSGVDLQGLSIAGGDFDAVLFYNTTSSPAHGSASGGGQDDEGHHPLPISLEPGGLPKASDPAKLSMTGSVRGSCLTGSDVAGTWGVNAFSSGGPLTVTVNGSSISDYDIGIAVTGAATAVIATDNSIHSCVSAGVRNFDSALGLDARQIWWGASDGPGGAGPGGGDPVVGAGVSIVPWRTLGVSGDVCAFVQSANAVTPIATESCVSTTNACATVEVDIGRGDTTPLRGFSVSVQLSPELRLCTPSTAVDVREGTYLSGVGGTTVLQVLDEGGGRYTVDCSILGQPCGATAATGTLFELDVTNVGGDGTGTVSVTGVILRDCSNGDVPALAGAAASVQLDYTAPAALSALTSTQQHTGNDTNGTTKIALTWSAVGAPDAASIAIYRKGFGGYPAYDDAGGTLPAVPASPTAALSAGWTLVTTLAATATATIDEPVARDFWYHVGFVTDQCGNVSTASALTAGALNYHLGDVTDGVTPGTGDNHVNTADLSRLGATYGLASTDLGFLYEVDVGPTTDGGVTARPTTDRHIQFEDMMVVAINYGQVSKRGADGTGLPAWSPPAPAAEDRISVRVPALPNVGQTFDVELSMWGTGQLLGVSTALAWNHDTVVPIAVSMGSWMGTQAGQPLVLSPRPGVIDASLLGAGGVGLRGTGVLAVVTFRVLASGTAGISVASVDARDAQNTPVPVAIGATTAPGAVPPRFARSVLSPAAPNPFNPTTTLHFVVAQAGWVSLRIVGVDGRAVRTLLQADLGVGEHAVAWNGTDDAGRRVSSGSYIARLDAPDARNFQRLLLVK